MYPSPDLLPNVSGTLSLPQISNLTIGSTYVLALVFVDVIPMEGTILEFDTGEYNASAAEGIAASSSSCILNCTRHLPIVWSQPTPIASFGGSPIQGDALAVAENYLYVAASSNNSTQLFASQKAGAPDSWFTVNGQTPIPGGTPELAASTGGCSVLVTTHNATRTFVTTFGRTCLTGGNPPPGGYEQEQSRQLASIVPLAGGSQAVYGAVPYQSTVGSFIEVYGSGFTGVQSVRFGNTATSFTAQSSTQLKATVPGGAGSTHVQVQVGGIWSSTNCSNLFSWGTPLPSGTPQVSWLASNTTTTGSLISIYGFNFAKSASVAFGGAPASTVFLNANNLQATVPVGTGTVNVTVAVGGLVSPITCADQFHYRGASLTSLSPSSGWTPLTVTLNGYNFSSSAQVYFGPNASAKVTYVSSTKLTASLPVGLGAVSVVVKQSGLTSNGVTFTYTPPVPSVLSVVPSRGPSGAGVVVLGGNFNSSGFKVFFGTTQASNAQWVAPGQVQAAAPSGSGTLDVTVHQFGKVSPTVCSDRFSYGAAYPTNLPAVISLSSSSGLSGAFITVRGWNLSTSDGILFDGVPTPFVNLSASNMSLLDLQVPLGIGNVSITAAATTGNSPFTCMDHFWIKNPGNPPIKYGRWSVNFTASSSAVPAFVGNGFLGGSDFVFADVKGELVADAIAGKTLTSTNVSLIGANLGSSMFAQIGGTEVTMAGGTAGQLAVTPDGNGIFLMATADQNGRTVLETLVWPGVGLAWGQPYFTTPVAGSAMNPQLASANYGDIYATWEENGNGPEQLELAVFAATGTLIQAPTVISGSGGGSGSGNAAGPYSLSVDPSGRPLAVWEWVIGPQAGAIAYTGAYEVTAQVVNLLQAAWATMTPADFEAFGGHGLAGFEAMINTYLVDVASDLSSNKVCAAQQVASNPLYTNITWIDPSPLVWGPTLSGCHVYVGTHHNTLLAQENGLLDADFFLSVETSWLLQSLGVGVMPIPNWANPMYAPPPGRNLPYWPDTGANSTNYLGDSLQVIPDTVSANALWLNVVGVFLQPSSSTPIYGSGGAYCGATTLVDQPTGYRLTASITDQAGLHSQTFNTIDWIPSPYFVSLYADENGTWSVSATATYSTLQTVSNSCGGTPANSSTYITTPAIWPTSVSFSLGANFTTGLDTFPGTMKMVSVPNHNPGQATATDALSWENTVNSTSTLWVNGTCGGCSALWTNTSYAQYDHAGGGSLKTAPTPISTLWIGVQSNNASVSPTLTPQYNVSEVSSPSPKQMVTEGCTVPKNATPPVWTNPGTNVSGLTTNSANLSWFSNVNDPGWATLNESGGGVFNQSAQVTKMSNGSYEYNTEVHGLDDWEVYSVTYYVLVTEGCVTPQGKTMVEVNLYDWTPGGKFQVPGQPLLFEQDLPYDSVSRQGGGAVLAWQVPLDFERTTGTTFINGSISVTSSNSSNTPFEIPLPSPLIAFTNYSVFGTSIKSATATTFAVNVSSLAPNNQYTFALILNYSTAVNPYFQAYNSLTFWYEKDTSGDGLTDWEKQYGWEVTTTNLGGGTVNTHVSANPNDYATNGLVGDFIEKEYGLNPNTVDSASSHMLDTWNVTFSLGSGSLPSGGNFQIWYENSTYNPFASSVAYSPGKMESGSPLVSNIANISPTSGHGRSSGDGSSWAARVLWSNGALTTFVGLSGVKNASWLRAVEGSYKGTPTLTVEGKLSWGANPLAASTPSTGVPDGARVNPLGGTDLSVTVAGWSVGGLTGGNGVAAYIDSTSAAAPYYPNGQANYGGWTSQVIVSGNSTAFYGGSFTVSFPVVPTEQFAKLNLTLVQNTGTGGGNSFQTALSTGVISVDLWNNSIQRPSPFTSGSNSLTINYVAVPVFAKVSTQVLVPAGNGTISNLPLGLTRYTGEQNFVLLEIYLNSSQITNTSIVTGHLPYPNATAKHGISGSYSSFLTSGINNLLVPRAYFINTPLGQALLNGTNVTIKSTGQNTFLQGQWTPNIWYAKATGSSYQGVAYGPPQSFQYVMVYSTQSQNSSGTPGLSGGIASDPGVEAATPTLAVGAVFVLNATGWRNYDSLLAGLLLNASGNYTAWLLNSTAYLTSLGISAVVQNFLANASLVNDGAYGLPISNTPTPPPWYDVVASIIWNAVSGVVAGLSIVWNAAVAAASYIADLASKIGSWALATVTQIAQDLKEVASAILSALNALLAYLERIVKAMFNTALGPFYSLRATFSQALDGAVDPTGSGPIWNALSTSLFDVAFAIAAVVIIGLTVLDLVTLGADEIIQTLLVGLVLTVGMSAISVILPAITSPSPALSSSAEEFANGSANQTPQAKNWTSWGGAFLSWEDGFSNSYAASSLQTDWSKTAEVPDDAYMEEADSFVFALMADALSQYANNGGGMIASDAALVCSFLSVGLEELSLLSIEASSIEAMDLVVLGMDIFALGVTCAELQAGE
ncbi:MAG: IPT/TIG domain-containing protein [Thermoplasmata archaeon]